MDKPADKPAAPIDDGSVSQDVQIEDGTAAESVDPTPAPEAPAPATTDDIVEAGDEIVPEAPSVKLKEFRNAKGELDIDKLEAILASRGTVEQQLADMNALVAKHPELKLAVAKTLKAEGRALSPDLEAILATPATAAVKPTIKANPAAGYETIQNWKAQGSTPEQIDAHLTAHYNKLIQTKTPGEAAMWFDTWVTQPKLQEALAARLAAQEETTQQIRTRQQSLEAIKAQCVEAAKAFPTVIVKADNEFGYMIKDRAIDDWITKHAPRMPVKEQIRLAAMALGRLKQKTAAKPGIARSGVQSKPVVQRPTSNDNGEVFSEMSIEE